MNIVYTPFIGVKILEPQLHEDSRGFFMESFNERVLERADILLPTKQENHSLSVQKGTLRGLHLQLPPYEQAKLIRVIHGEILDVIVDLRNNSPSFKQHYKIVLSAENKKQLYIPKGFAHGFVTLTENTEVIYKTDEYYAPEFEGGIIWNDKELNIDWGTFEPLLSNKDRSMPPLTEAMEKFSDRNGGENLVKTND
ncbi:dTDP-4-dehydrorhamnose 3,5-epimerase [Alkalicoccus daliensis]|uniref:dTDP-4-dehydrorhamnose 3,5-epimerase n=1 Tax=Alkalicoccus daliensis TaxID=745820 RepID=A0A1G9ZMT1_9BACI|nr:dTDP-4-dehydrorhamnose 3,5-epimerase [Alkalicoccus daliensis]SDN22417.1 dTDP-4-dehydrorhamnose 3,5-epimerase [Alkalicoccus daliensis]